MLHDCCQAVLNLIKMIWFAFSGTIKFNQSNGDCKSPLRANGRMLICSEAILLQGPPKRTFSRCQV